MKTSHRDPEVKAAVPTTYSTVYQSISTTHISYYINNTSTAPDINLQAQQFHTQYECWARRWSLASKLIGYVNPMAALAGCCYFLPELRLPLMLQRTTALRWIPNYTGYVTRHLWTIHPQWLPGSEPSQHKPFSSWIESNTLTITLLPHQVNKLRSLQVSLTIRTVQFLILRLQSSMGKT